MGKEVMEEPRFTQGPAEPMWSADEVRWMDEEHGEATMVLGAG